VDKADTTGVDKTNNEPVETTGVDKTTDLEDYVNELEAELDQEIAGLDSDYDSEPDKDDIELDNTFDSIDDDEADDIRTDTTREQTSADDQSTDGKTNDSDDEESPDGDDPTQPLPELRWNRTPNYAHLKGCDGDGSLISVMHPNEFKGGRHQSHIILQSIIMTQYNLKQGIKKFGAKGKEAVLAELQQMYDLDVMAPVSKYDLTSEERKGALR
jgi:hypothetical protein